MTFAPPAGRGRWRLTLHDRRYIGTNFPGATGISELVDARSRRLEQTWNASAALTFTVDGHSPTAAMLTELGQDVIAWRWDEAQNRDIPMFRGPITQTEDQITEQSHTVNVTCHDYLAVMQRRSLAAPYTGTQVDQDTLAQIIVSMATAPTTSAGPSGAPPPLSLLPGGYLPLSVARVNPNGTTRTPLSGQLRDRTYVPGAIPGQLLDDLANVIGGFDYDVYPRSDLYGVDQVRIFYPVQGVTRADMALIYGSTISGLTRTVDSGAYANYIRVIGNNASSDPAAPQLFAERWNADATAGQSGAVGLWQTVDNASDVSVQATLNDQAAGNLALSGILVPSYTLTMRPGAYTHGNPNMGDTVPLVVQSGRLNVSTTIRVLGINYSIGDDGDEDVELTVGRPAVTLAHMLTATGRDVDALARR